MFKACNLTASDFGGSVIEKSTFSDGCITVSARFNNTRFININVQDSSFKGALLRQSKAGVNSPILSEERDRQRTKFQQRWRQENARFAEQLNPEILNDSNLTEGEKSVLISALKRSDYEGTKAENSIAMASLFIKTVVYGFLLWLLLDFLNLPVQIGRHVVIFGVALILFWFASRVRGIQYGFKEAGVGHKMKKDWRRPILYLRSFTSDGAREIKNVKPTRNPFEIADVSYSVERKVWTVFQSYGPVCALHGHSNGGFGVPSKLARVGDSHWKELASAGMKISSAVVFVVTGDVNDSILWEIGRLAEYKEPKDVIFFIPREGLDAEGIVRFFSAVRQEFKIAIHLNGITSSCYLGFNEKKNCYKKVDYIYWHLRKLRTSNRRSKRKHPPEQKSYDDGLDEPMPDAPTPDVPVEDEKIPVLKEESIGPRIKEHHTEKLALTVVEETTPPDISTDKKPSGVISTGCLAKLIALVFLAVIIMVLISLIS